MNNPLRALDEAWLASQPKEKQAGLLLGAYMERDGIRQGRLAEQVGLNTQTLYQWKSGKVALPDHKAGLLVPYLRLKNDEIMRFIMLASPDITEHVGVIWLNKQIKNKNWQALSYPAFDDEWLDAQPAERKAGLMLRQGRQRLSMSQLALANLLGVSREAENHWELAGQIPTNKIGSVIKYLEFSEAQAQRFIQAAYPAIAAASSAEWITEKVKAADALSLDFPALDNDWLAAQPPHLQAGLLLRAYRERAHLTLTDLANATGMTKHAVSNWETIKDRIPANKTGTLARMLALTPDEAEKLVTLAQPGLLHSAGAEWIKEKIAQSDWHHIDYPALDPQWLERQSPLHKAGLMLRAYRERRDMKQETLALAVFRDRDLIGNMERGTSPVSEIRVALLSDALHLTPEERHVFSEAARESVNARRIAGAQTSLGATLTGYRARALPGIDTETSKKRG